MPCYTQWEIMISKLAAGRSHSRRGMMDGPPQMGGEEVSVLCVIHFGA